jgi:hypothetical protein
VEATRQEAQVAQGATHDLYERPIVAADKKAQVDALVTFDRKHLLQPSVAAYIGALVCRPDEALRRVRAQLKEDQ